MQQLRTLEAKTNNLQAGLHIITLAVGLRNEQPPKRSGKRAQVAARFLTSLALLCNSTSPSPSKSIPFGVPQPQILANLIVTNDDNSTKHKTLLVESYHEHRRLKVLLAKLNKKGSCPLEMLQDDGDWSKEHFWAVIRFLKLSSRSKEVLQVFDTWKNIEKSRINEFNYEKIIGLLSEEDLMEDASLAFMEMKSFGLSPSLQIYNSLVHSYARNGKFDDALFYLNQMKETNLPLESDTYDGLIQAYGKYKMYDEMGMCLKKMELDGCSPDCFTYNLLIQEFAQAEKMDKILRRVWNSKATLKEDLIRKMAVVYIENFMYSRLDDLGDDLSSRNGKTDIVWCLHLLSNSCSLSQKGMDSIVREMEQAKVSWNVTFANIILLAYLKMKDFTHLRMLLSKLTNLHVEPDIVTVGILFDACDLGFHGTGILETWRRMGLLYRCVEMQTDPLVLTAFGKGQFLRRCEEAYSSLDPNAREKKSGLIAISLIWWQRTMESSIS
ncbi:hypothetical protein GH714_041421 [Hevea brasiliensis]|uniref:Uncharacterized protein n=1 Tax=Hevea brasiliensis TaxID=3981 RepID=A0A6A6MWB6_HEVBR|nr:hypothetical protein GH714_041421 [Hevea brasiliensis]